MTRQEAIEKLSTIGHISVSYAEDLYDSFFEKPVVPQFVADWYEGHRDNYDYELWDYLVNWDYQKENDFKQWIRGAKNQSIITLVNMHQFGYEVEKEARYTVKVKGISEINRYLNQEYGEEFLFADSGETEDYRTKFTRKELEANGFGWVFDCEGVEVTEVE